MARLPGEIDGERFLRALRRFGWQVVWKRGSHRFLVHEETGRKMTLAFHTGVRRPIAKKLLKYDRIPEDEFLDELLVHQRD